MAFPSCRLLCALLISAFISYPVMSDPIRIVTTDWAPYFASELREGGVITAITKAAYSKAGVETTFRFVPWKRAIQEVEEGKSDVLMGAYYSHDRARRFAFIHPVFEVKIHLIDLKSLGIDSFNQLEDLKEYKIGIGRGWVNSEAFDKATYLNKEEASNQILNIRKLFRKRIDMVVMSKGVFLTE